MGETGEFNTLMHELQIQKVNNNKTLFKHQLIICIIKYKNVNC